MKMSYIMATLAALIIGAPVGLIMLLGLGIILADPWG